jgi:hypothetical protein
LAGSQEVFTGAIFLIRRMHSHEITMLQTAIISKPQKPGHVGILSDLVA